MQERGSARGSTVLHRALHLRIAAGQVEAIRKKIVEVGAVSEIALDPARGCLHRDAEPIVFAHEQHRRGQFLVGRPGGRIERRLRAGVVGRRIAERADRDAVIGNRQPMTDAPCLLDGHRGAERLRQMRCDRRGLRQHPQRFGSPHLVAAAGGRIVLAGREAQRRIEHRIHPRQLAEALGHEAARAVVQECRVRMASQPRHHRIALMAAGADRVEDLAL